MPELSFLLSVSSIVQDLGRSEVSNNTVFDHSTDRLPILCFLYYLICTMFAETESEESRSIHEIILKHIAKLNIPVPFN